MRSWGILFLILGIGSFILPKMGYQFKLLSAFGEENTWIAGLVLAVLGAILLGISLMAGKKPDTSAKA